MAAKACVIGLWHLGCTISCAMAEKGRRVTGFDYDSRRIESLRRGMAPIFEPGLEEALKKNLRAGTLSFTADIKSALKGASVAVLAFDTKIDEHDDVDLAQIFDACRDVMRFSGPDCLLMISSQLPAGTCGQIKKMAEKEFPSRRLFLAYVPENLRLGNALVDFLNPSFVVIGTDDIESRRKADAFYRVVQGPKHHTNLVTAEMIKHALNAYSAGMICMANELARVCEVLGADAQQLARVVKTDGRFGPKAPVFPGLPFSGGTLARDVKALNKIASLHGISIPLLGSVFESNDAQKQAIMDRVRSVVDSGSKVAVFGITYKSGTSTVRRSYPLEMVRELVRDGCGVSIYDKMVNREEVPPEIRPLLVGEMKDAVRGASAILVLAEWPELKNLDMSALGKAMKSRAIIDCKNALDPGAAEKSGFAYYGMGGASAGH
jgi:UDPglucose 6-dehydrogenase